MIITVLDTETTGLDLLQHEVIEVGIVQARVDPTRIIRTKQWQTKIKPRYIERASPIALKINGYTDEKWANAAMPTKAIAEIKSYIQTSSLLVGQNLIFDLRFINKLFEDHGEMPLKFPNYYDTKMMAEGLVKLGKLKSSSLDFLSDHFNVKNYGRPHTALADANRTLEVYKILSKQTTPVQLSVNKPYDPYEGKQMTDQTDLGHSNSVQNVMAYGTPAAKAEIIARLIYIGNVEVLQKVYDAIPDKELDRIIGFAQAIYFRR